MVKKSSLHEIYEENGAEFKEYGDWKLPAEINGFDEEYQAIRESLGIMDRSEMPKFKISGDNALEFLNKVCTENIHTLYEGKSLCSALCREDGSVVSLVYLLKDSENFWLIAEDPGKESDIEDWLEKHLESGVELENVTSQYGCISVLGVDSQSFPKSLVGDDILGLAFGGVMRGEIEGVDCMLWRFGLTGEFEYRFIIDNQKMEEVWPSFAEVKEKQDAPLCGRDVLETLKLEMKSVDLAEDAAPDTDLFELQMQWVVDFRKEDFIGLEALEQKKEEGLDRKLLFMTFPAEANLSEGSDVWLEEEKIGFLQHVGYSPETDQGICTAYLDQDYAWVGLNFEVEDESGERVPVETVSSPFFLTKSVVPE